MIKKSDLLSVMKYQAGQIVVDERSPKLSEDDKMYSMSISKSFIGYLGDSRAVERKKPGRRKARRSFQFSKR